MSKSIYPSSSIKSPLSFDLFRDIVVLVIMAFVVVLSSCGETKETASDPALLAKKMSFPYNTPKVAVASDIASLRSHAKTLIELRQKNMKEDLFDLTYYYLSPRGFSNLGTTLGQAHYEGYWTKFEKDYTYSYGIGGDVVGGGVYHYSSSTQMLLMLDNDIQIEPKLWSLLSNSEFFNFLGHPMIVIEDANGNGQILMKNFANDKFIDQQNILVQSNNGMQIMLTLEEERPTT